MKNPAPRGGVSKGRHFDFCVASHGESTQGSSATGALRGRLHAALPLEGATLAPEIDEVDAACDLLVAFALVPVVVIEPVQCDL